MTAQNIRTSRLIAGALLLTLMLLSIGCASTDHPDGDGHSESETSVTGVLIAVEGDLLATKRIEILTDTGESMSFSVTETATFDGGPISHVRDHLISGQAVTIEYVVLEDGKLQATYLEDSHD